MFFMFTALSACSIANFDPWGSCCVGKNTVFGGTTLSFLVVFGIQLGVIKDPVFRWEGP